MNELFELIEDSDLDDTGNARSWVWTCPNCNALFGSKAIHNRTIFPFFGYHPADGNCRVITDKTAGIIHHRAHICECPEQIARVKSVKQLTKAIEANKEVGKGD